MTVSGTQTIINTETLNLADNLIDLNSNFTSGAPTENAGIRIIRGDELPVQLRWNETVDQWQFTVDGSNYNNIASQSVESYANSAFGTANTVDSKAVTAGSYANSAFGTANTATANAATADGKAVTAGSYANAAFGIANTADVNSISAGNYANAAFAVANSGITDSWARDTANAASSYANSGFYTANSSGLYANAAFAAANTGVPDTLARDTANAASSYANSSFNTANTADSKAVSAGSYANSAFGAANTTAIYANAAFADANTKFSSSGGTISGNVTILYDLSVLGNVSFTGNVTSVTVTGNSGQFFGEANGHNALYAGIPVGYDYQPHTVFQASTNEDNYSQINIQNINPGNNASSDYVATADNGTENDTYIDMGIASSLHADPEFTLVGPNDGYLYVSGNTVTGGGGLVIGTLLENDVIFTAGGMNEENEQMRIIGSSNTINIRSNVDSSIAKSVLLGPIANLHITGGSNDDYIRTDGSGNLTFANLTSANVIKVLYDTANTTSQTAVSSSSYANGAFAAANTADQKAVTAGTYANAAFAAANTGASSSDQYARDTANAASSYANSSYSQANTATTNAATADGKAVTAGSYANAAFALANTSDSKAVTAGNYANSAYGQWKVSCDTEF